MASNVTRMQAQPVPQQGNWVWDGTQWVCGPCDDGGGFPFCPPPGFPPAGCPPWYSGANSPPWYPGANAGVSFGTTAPINPVRGHFWWNGLVLALFDGAAWVNTATGVIIPINGSSGGTPQPVPGPAFTTTTGVLSIIQSSQLTIPASSGSTFTITPFVSTPTVDLLSGYDSITKKWTPNRPGIYMVLIMGFALTTGGGAYAQAVLKNDQGTYNWSTPVQTVCVFDDFSASSAGIFNAVGMVTMNGTTDYLRHWSYSTTGAIYLPTTATPTFAVVAMP